MQGRSYLYYGQDEESEVKMVRTYDEEVSGCERLAITEVRRGIGRRRRTGER